MRGHRNGQRADAAVRKVCSRCKVEKSGDQFYRKSLKDSRPSCWCVQCMADYYRAAKQDAVLGPKIRSQTRAYQDGLRSEMLLAYGSKCVGYPIGYVCSETRREVLQIDHVDNDGSLLARNSDIPRGGWPLYLYLKRNGWPKDKFQLLCANCNHLKMLEHRRANMKDRKQSSVV